MSYSLLSRRLQTLLGALFLAAGAFTPSIASAQALNTKCPMMTEDDVEEEKAVDFKGNKILMCCGKCEKAWNASSDASKTYWAKVATDLGLLPQLKGKEKELGFEEVKLIDQRFSAVSHKTIVTPESPTVEYKGKKYHVFNDKEVEKWNKNPDASYEKAVAAGVIK